MWGGSICPGSIAPLRRGLIPPIWWDFKAVGICTGFGAKEAVPRFWWESKRTLERACMYQKTGEVKPNQTANKQHVTISGNYMQSPILLLKEAIYTIIASCSHLQISFPLTANHQKGSPWNAGYFSCFESWCTESNFYVSFKKGKLSCFWIFLQSCSSDLSWANQMFWKSGNYNKTWEDVAPICTDNQVCHTVTRLQYRLITFGKNPIYLWNFSIKLSLL